MLKSHFQEVTGLQLLLAQVGSESLWDSPKPKGETSLFGAPSSGRDIGGNINQEESFITG